MIYFSAFIDSTGNVEIIAELYRKLLRRIGLSVNPEKWEKSLLKVSGWHPPPKNELLGHFGSVNLANFSYFGCRGRGYTLFCYHECYGCLPFTWKTQKFQLENQRVHIIPFGVLLKLWASGQSDTFLLLLLGVTADVHTFCMLSILG